MAASHKTSSRKAARKPKRLRIVSLRFPAPRAVQLAAREGLALVHEGYGGRGLTREAIARAKNLARGGSITLTSRSMRGKTVKASAQFMAAWFSRHKVDKRPGWRARKTPGWVAWQIWGGDAGRHWVTQLLRRYGS